MSQTNPGEFCPFPYEMLAVMIFVIIETRNEGAVPSDLIGGKRTAVKEAAVFKNSGSAKATVQKLDPADQAGAVGEDETSRTADGGNAVNAADDGDNRGIGDAANAVKGAAENSGS